jgi:hypothetical protein
MVASLLKVISSGIQDERLTFKHTMYPFKKIWIKAGRFTTQWGRLEFESPPTFGNTSYCRLLRKGHLITRLFLVAQMPDIYSAQARAKANSGTGEAHPKFGWTNSLGHALVERLTLDIASSRVETMDSRLLEILDEFGTPLERVPVMNELIKRKDHGFTETSFGHPPVGALPNARPYYETVVVPLPFFFCKGDDGCPLPIDAITFDDILVGIQFRNLNGLYYTDTHVPNTSLAEGSSLWPLSGSNFYANPLATGATPSNPGQVPLSNANGVIEMPNNLQLRDCYIMAEYVYLDQPSANRFRLADLQIPIVTYNIQQPYDTRSLPTARIPLTVSNPAKELFFMLNRVEAPSYNAHMLATRDLTGTVNTLPNNSQFPWWPDCLNLYSQIPSIFLRPGFSLSDSEPITGLELLYEGNLVRYRSESPALFRSVIPSRENRKSPFINRYYYTLPFSIEPGFTPPSRPNTEANFSKIIKKDLILHIRPKRGLVGGADTNRFVIYSYITTYNILRAYGGRCSLMFSN